jgi:hypothetical protein
MVSATRVKSQVMDTMAKVNFLEKITLSLMMVCGLTVNVMAGVQTIRKMAIFMSDLIRTINKRAKENSIPKKAKQDTLVPGSRVRNVATAFNSNWMDADMKVCSSTVCIMVKAVCGERTAPSPTKVNGKTVRGAVMVYNFKHQANDKRGILETTPWMVSPECGVKITHLLTKANTSWL